MRLSSSFGNAAAKVANNNSKSKTSANHGEGGEGDPNADSLESRLSGMSIEEEEWRGLDGVALGIGSLNGSMRDAGKPSSNNGSGAFRLSPRDDWGFRSSQHSAAEGAAAAALSGSLGNQPYPTSHSMLHDNQYDELGDSIHHTQQFSHNPSRRIPSPTGSMDEEDWDLLCVLGSTPKGMSASSPSMLSYNHNYNGHGGGGIGKNNQSSIPLQTSTSLPRKQKNRTVNRVSPPRGHSPPKSSMNGRMTPRAQALMTLNEDFKAGRIDKDEKLRMKEKILHGK
jgi:hypothetical protein